MAALPEHARCVYANMQPSTCWFAFIYLSMKPNEKTGKVLAEPKMIWHSKSKIYFTLPMISSPFQMITKFCNGTGLWDEIAWKDDAKVSETQILTSSTPSRSMASSGPNIRLSHISLNTTINKSHDQIKFKEDNRELNIDTDIIQLKYIWKQLVSMDGYA